MSQEALESRTGELPQAKAVSEQAVADCVKVEGDGSMSYGSTESGGQAGDAPAKLETPRDATNADRDAIMTGVESPQNHRPHKNFHQIQNPKVRASINPL
ncbi:hypothetical protein QBC44DRAFT_365221 [Cladorrhinum sp. PSN332]|nr:hypothetical protein QBC44DRAFT_365221 [Cladorrhinum sp. PSN332]